ncbi:MAG: Flp pilus assembly protein CpaB [Nevskia sp.]
MSSKAIQAVAIILGIIAIILIVFVWRLSRSFAENVATTAPATQVQQQQAAAPQYLIVIATAPLAANVPIKKDDVVLAPVTIQPTEYFANVEDVVGRTPLVDLDKGQPVTPRFFKDSNIIARGIPPGSRALSLKVDDVVGVGGFVRPGDVVDVLVYIKAESNTPTGEKAKAEDIATQARVLLKDVLVLSYEDHLVEPPKGLEEKDKNKAAQQQRRERTAVVAVPEAQVTRVLLGASLGELRLALHGSQPTDAQQAAAAPASADAGISSLPLSDAAKTKAKTPEPPDQVVTAIELGKVKPVAPPGVKLPPRPRIEVYRGSKLEQVYP